MVSNTVENSRVGRTTPVVVGVQETHTVSVVGRRVSWGAILAGVVVAIVIQLALNMLGLSIGANTINPVSERDPIGPAFDNGAIIWIAGSLLLSLFAGGWVAGRLAGNPDETDGMLHGIVTWGIVTLLTIMFITSTVGGIIGGISNVISRGANLAGQAVTSLVPQAAEALDLQNVTLESVTQEVRTLLSQTDDPALQPEAIEGQAEEAGQIAQNTVDNIAQTPTLAQLQLQTAVRQFLSLDAIEETDRQDLVNVLVERTNLTEEEARQTIDRWEQAYMQVRADAEETLRQAGQTVADGIAVAAGILFGAMALGAFAAGAGGYVGAPQRTIVTTTETE
jgi:hypothetical protein